MLENIKKLFNKSGEEGSKKPSLNREDKFTLKIKNLSIGELWVDNKTWHFKYFDNFKAQNKYRRITGFSDLNREYESDILWPFFKIRIPGLGQPMIQEIIEKENLDAKDEIVLLKRFGQLSISNPYVLEMSED